MNWLTNVVRPKIRSLLKREVQENLWIKCPDTGQLVFYKDVEANHFVIPASNYHMRMGAAARLKSMFDGETWIDIGVPEVATDPLKFRDERRYTDRLKDARTKTGLNDAIKLGFGRLEGLPVVIGVQDFDFMGGSLGMAAGEALIKGLETAAQKGTPFIMFAASGGARMHEGILALMQLPRTTVAVETLREAHKPYIVVLTNPTTGGVTASYAMLGDVHIAEPGALIGFAGPRVIEQTIREKLPDGFQRAEYLKEHGFVDMVVHRHELRGRWRGCAGCCARRRRPRQCRSARRCRCRPKLRRRPRQQHDAWAGHEDGVARLLRTPMTPVDSILARLLALHPKRIDLSLDRMWRVLERLGSPQRRIPPVIHVAGTNGKGSTIAFLRAMLEAAGKSVHVYTSPNLVRVNERFRLGGLLVSDVELADALAECERANGDSPITLFEIETAAAFVLFARHAADMLLLEVGLGGRLDATNVIERPLASVVTPVSMDHIEFLGDTLEKIAAEKAGIFRAGVPAVIAPQSAAGSTVLERQAEKARAPLHVAGQHWHAHVENGRLVYQDEQGLLDLPPPKLFGRHQFDNAGTAIAALRAAGIRLPVRRSSRD